MLNNVNQKWPLTRVMSLSLLTKYKGLPVTPPATPAAAPANVVLNVLTLPSVYIYPLDSIRE